MPSAPLNPDAFDFACKELFLTITAHKSAADVLGFDWKSLKASTRKPWETATRKVLTAYLEADGTADEMHEINTRLARILTDTANALKGEPDPLTLHSWHDLADVAKRAVAQPVVNSVEAFINQRPEYITALKNTRGTDDQSDYHRWQGGAEARRQLAQALGWTVPHNPGETTRPEVNDA